MVQGVTDEEKTFDDSSFGLDKRILKAVHDLGYAHPTLVQAQSIPLILSGKDVLVKARTGSGKTIAYAVPAVQKLLSLNSNVDGIKVVVLVPSKELCMQTFMCFKSLTRYCSSSVNCVALYDTNVEQQRDYLNAYTDVVISTPKLLLSHLKLHQENLLKNIHTFVIDEADLLLSYGYESDVNAVVDLIPATCQNVILSATLTDDVNSLKKKLLHNCVTIKLKEENTNLKEFYIDVSEKDKPLLLYALLRLHIIKGKVIIFVNNLELGYYLYIFLSRFSMKAVVLNNELPLLSRNNIIYQFNRGLFDYLIATDEGIVSNEDTEPVTSESKNDEEEDGDLLKEDEEEKEVLKEDDDLLKEDEEEDGDLLKEDEESEIDEEDGLFDMSDEEAPSLDEEKEDESLKDEGEYAISRGIDFENVSAVVNYSLASSVASYIHRIGRTARAENLGTALSFVDMNHPEEKLILTEIQKHNPPRDGHPVPQKLPFDVKEIESFTYRVEDVKRGINKKLIKDTRVMELRREALNSAKLKMHFEDNPQELKMLQHGAAKKLIRPQPHLKDIPDYLIPDVLKPKVTVKDTTNSRREKMKDDYKRKKVDDPLHSFAVTAELLSTNSSVSSRRNQKVYYITVV
ncbi:RNA helicase [Blastocystis sp. subtype 4]|uniref:RNA helicase n=1 Tax=Blastocystis sp. subtype 4 TaxID=944170 RepID=UPI00071130FE|nr:RNA helicase [Blastocystis sp. subtype 4]KNB46670.1 RNA helicase [Blastocystis sp. subtype 4]|eukprot:XP_014530102.1 RNA helicase [Blastocystis sp. subtype 4]